MSPHDVVIITALTHPATFGAFEIISHDCGRQAGHLNYAIPVDCATHLDAIEQQLATLLATADSDFECLCIGEQEESQEVVKNYGLEHADQLLHAFFEEFA